jgi:phage terminase large subunit-like protein
MTYLKTQEHKYAVDVLNGTIPACLYVKQACQRYMNDLKRSDITFNAREAAKAITFVEAQKHTKGEWKGRNFKIEPWQKFIIANLFGFIRTDGRRKYTRAYLEMPKKQGKSPLSAAIGNYMLYDVNDGSPEVYSAATKLDQAAIVWQYAADMFNGLSMDYDLDSQVSSSFNNKRIVYNGGVFRPVAYDERDKNDGLSVSCAIIDEYHAHPSDRIYNVLADGMAARRSPLLLAITTAGHDRESACYKHRDYCTKVLNGNFIDDDLFVLIYTIDEGDEWDEEATWKKANPNFGISVKPDYIQSKISEARESGIKRDSFLIKHLNVWTDSYETWIASSIYKSRFKEFDIPDGTQCYGGLDLASTGDFTALSFDFLMDGKHYIKSFYYLPEDAIRQWPGQMGQQIRQWVRDGWIIQTPGNTTDYDFVELQIKQFAEKYEIVSIGYDPSNSKQFAAKLFADGVNMRQFSQGIMNMNKPTKTVDELIRGGNYFHDNNPCTEWQFGNVALYRDANDNHKVIKGKDPNKKVDGVVSIIMAVGEAIDEDNKKEWFFMPSVV